MSNSLDLDLKAARANVAAGIMTYPETVRTILEAYDNACDELADYRKDSSLWHSLEKAKP